MTITRLKNTMPQIKRHPLGVMDSYVHFMIERNGGPEPTNKIHKLLTVKAYINHSRWVADCPLCNGAELVDPSDPRFYCTCCYNQKINNQWIKVIFPLSIEAIEAELIKRPDLPNRNWKPEESVQDLQRENQEHGIS